MTAPARLFLALSLALSVVSAVVCGVSAYTLNRALTVAVTEDAAVEPLVIPIQTWENPHSPWMVAAHNCEPRAAHVLAVWREVAQDEHSDGFWAARFTAETQRCGVRNT